LLRYSSVHKNDLDHLFRYKCPAPLPPNVVEQIRRLTRDFPNHRLSRLYTRGFPAWVQRDLHILEINALPGITPRSDMTMMAKAEGRTHSELVASVLAAALRRYRLS
jgi:D-alanine-D-alanine ligase-like ATP-grasp enzyme